MHLRSFPAVQVLSEKLWRGANKEKTYADFEALCKTTPEAPGINLLARVSGKKELLQPNEVRSLNGTDSLSTSIPEIGYPYTVSFGICPDKDTNISGVLFKGPHSVVYTNWENTGRIAFSRDGYTFVFNSFQLPTEQWTDIRIEGDYKGTSLYVNGKLQERLEGRTMKVYRKEYKRMEYMTYQETLIFPLEQIGDKLNGFKGKLRNLTCEQPR